MVRSPSGTGSTRQQLGEHMGNPEGQGLRNSDALWSQNLSPGSQKPLPTPGHTHLIMGPRLDESLDGHTNRTFPKVFGGQKHVAFYSPMTAWHVSWV